ncbi:MAG: hypothetical protein IKA82_03185 [Clostridia bacterium]|nr:hypothetical protein [Clostridia bacterium]
MYLATVYQGKFDTSAALWQLYGEYFCGHYQNVISICKMKLDDPKMATRYKYHYLTYLANVYFELGDNENLRKICEQFEAAISKEKTNKQAKLRSFFSRIEFFDHYLNRNIDACMNWLDTPVNMPVSAIMLTQYHRNFCKARLALVQGNVEQADKYYEVLSKEASQLNYGKLAKKYLEEKKEQAPDDSLQTLNISDETSTVTLCHPSSRKRWIRFGIYFLVVILLSGAVAVLKYEREMEAYRESIQVLVEQDYDGVEVLDTFTLKNGISVVDTMFICKTDKDIIVGCTYIYEDGPEQYYEKLTDISIASLSEDRSPLWYCSFPSITSHNQIESYFYTVEADVPADYVHLSTFEINGQKVYYVITEIVPGIVITMPAE